MTKIISEEAKLLSLASRALEGGAIIHSLTRFAWDVSGKCQNPVYREANYMARPAAMKPFQEAVKVRTSETPMRRLELDTRCRKCPPCLRARAAYWRKRAESEIGQTKGRTWFVTLTLSPESHFQMLLRADHRLAGRGVTFEALSEDEKFVARHNEIGKEITLWMKRVRKAAATPLRYFLVAEAHKSGLPHYHVLVHEGSDVPLPARVLRDQWKLGFSQAKLVAQGDERKSASYVAKYLSKAAIARVRASQGYGHISQQDNGLSHRNVTSFRERRGKPPLTHTHSTTEGVPAVKVTDQ